MKSGFIVVDKSVGFTSHDVVAIARKSLHERRVGHAGTLDPFATGVLVLGVGQGTRLLQYITDGKKSYQGTIRLGAATTTDDLTGEVIFENFAGLSSISEKKIIDLLAKQVGEIYQRPSDYSAIKVNGKRAYELARAGQQVQLKERKVTIYSLVVEKIVRDSSGIDVQIAVECSAGTYIRSIARDLGSALEVGGYLTSLRRVRVDPFSLADAISMDQLKEEPSLTSIDDAIGRIFLRRMLSAEEVASISHGRSIALAQQSIKAEAGEFSENQQNQYAAFTPEGRFIALLTEKGGRAQPILVINHESS
ncbi:MAG: tRNA pseudouridine(55) synthase TruB [Actinobacteria bacterium]|uniref:tRNA pseudouridine synthase B n=1 Tax=Candidatus Fonsibacter lacus TaxID=2576439 RepID=A0A965LKR2_9PROT|nr:tRNA pseudouridine(55) synthase TruB [Candidatus Fonsibacter lacus]